MRIIQDRFSVPDCIFTEPMAATSRILLLYLFNVSDIGGQCRPGYAAMKRALRETEANVGSNHTINKHLELLKKKGWIFHMKKTNGRMAIYLQIPGRFKKAKAEKTLLSVVH